MCSTVMVNTPDIDPTFLTDDLYRRLVANALQTPEVIDMPYLSLQTPPTGAQQLQHQSVIHPLAAITTSDSDLLDLSQRSAAQSVIITATGSQTSNQLQQQQQHQSLPVLSPSIYQYLPIINTRAAPVVHHSSASSQAYITPVPYSSPDTIPPRPLAWFRCL